MDDLEVPLFPETPICSRLKIQREGGLFIAKTQKFPAFDFHLKGAIGVGDFMFFFTGCRYALFFTVGT